MGKIPPRPSVPPPTRRSLGADGSEAAISNLQFPTWCSVVDEVRIFWETSDKANALAHLLNMFFNMKAEAESKETSDEEDITIEYF